MAIARDKVSTIATGTAVASVTIGFASNPVAGSTVLIGGSLYTGSPTVTDNGTSPSTFIQDSTQQSFNVHSYVHRANNITLPGAGSYQITWSRGTADFITAGAVSYTGMASGAPVTNQVSGASASTTSLTSGPITNPNAASLYFGVAVSNASGSSTWSLTSTGTGWAAAVSGTAQIPLATADNVGVTGAQTATWTQGTSSAYATSTTTYNASAVTPTATFVAASGGSSTATSGSVVTAFPAGATTGDFVVLSFYEITTSVTRLPSGWTVIREADVAGDPHHVLVCYKVLVGGDIAPSITVAGKSAWTMQAFRPASGNTLALDTSNNATDLTTAATTITPPALTATGGVVSTISVIAAGGRASGTGATAITTAQPTNYSEFGVANTASGADQSTASGTTTALRQIFAEQSYQQAVSGTVTPGAVTASATSFLSAQHILIKETAAAATANFVPTATVRRRSVRRVPVIRINAGTAIPGGAPLPPLVRRPTSRVRRKPPFPARSASITAPPDVMGGFPTAKRRIRRMPRLDVGGDSFEPPFTQAATPPVNPSITQLITGRYRLIGRIKPRARVGNPTPDQVVVPSVNPTITQLLTGRRSRVLLELLRRTRGETTPPFDQSAPSASSTAVRRRLPTLRRSRVSTVAPQAPAALTEARRPRRVEPPARRGHVTSPPVHQATPAPHAETRGLRRLLVPARRGHAVTPPQVQQVAPTNPAYPLAEARGLRRFLAPARRAHAVTPTPAQQVAPVNPAITQLTVVRGRLGARALRRGKAVIPTPAQQTVITNPPITQLTAGRLRLVARVKPRSKVANPVQQQLSAVPAVVQRPRRITVVRRRPALSVPTPTQPEVPAGLVRRSVRAAVRAVRRSRIAQALGGSLGLPFGPMIVTTSTNTTVSTFEDSTAVVTGTEASSSTVTGTYDSVSIVALERTGGTVSEIYNSDPDVQ